MAGSFNDNVARVVRQGDVAIVATAWTPLVVSTSPLPGRRHIRYNIKSNPGGALALQYVAKNLDGTFTNPTTAAVQLSTIYPGNTTVVEPIGDAIQVFGRLVKKKAFANSSIRVIVSEFA